MDLKNFILIKNNDGKPSVTLSAFIYGFIVVNAKLIMSGITIGTMVMAPFSGSEYGISIAALGSIYVLRKNVEKKAEPKA